MRFTSAAVAAAMLVLSGSAASAQVRPSITIAAGMAMPVGHLADDASWGYHIQGSLGVTPAALPVALRADLFFQQIPDDHDGNFSAVGGLANAVLGLPGALARTYLIGGLGIGRYSSPEVDHGGHAHAGESGTGLAFAGGGGVRFGLGTMAANLEVRVLHAGGEHTTVPITFGITF